MFHTVHTCIYICQNSTCCTKHTCCSALHTWCSLILGMRRVATNSCIFRTVWITGLLISKRPQIQSTIMCHPGTVVPDLVCSTLLVCLFVGIKPEKLYSASCGGGEVNPVGVITHGQRHKPRAYQRQRHMSHTRQSMLKTLQVDGRARIPGPSGSYSTTYPQPPNGVPPCLVWRVGFGRGRG